MTDYLRTILWGFFLLLFSVRAQATLIGDSITISHYYPNLFTVHESHNTVVQAGIGDIVTISNPGPVLVYSVNPEASAINVQFHNPISFATGAFNGLVVTGIDEAILNYSIATNMSGWGEAFRLSSTAHSFAVNWVALSATPETFFRITLETALPTPDSGGSLAIVAIPFFLLLIIHRVASIRPERQFRCS